MNKHYVTFGQIHVHRINGHTLDKDGVAIIYAADVKAARQLVSEWFDNLYHNLYSESEWDSSDLEYYPRGLIEINH